MEMETQADAAIEFDAVGSLQRAREEAREWLRDPANQAALASHRDRAQAERSIMLAALQHRLYEDVSAALKAANDRITRLASEKEAAFDKGWNEGFNDGFSTGYACGAAEKAGTPE